MLIFSCRNSFVFRISTFSIIFASEFNLQVQHSDSQLFITYTGMVSTHLLLTFLFLFHPCDHIFVCCRFQFSSQSSIRIIIHPHIINGSNVMFQAFYFHCLLFTLFWITVYPLIRMSAVNCENYFSVRAIFFWICMLFLSICFPYIFSFSMHSSSSNFIYFLVY